MCMDKECEREGCASRFAVRTGRGKPRRFCSSRCQVRAWRGEPPAKHFLYAGTFIESFFQFKPGTVSSAAEAEAETLAGIRRPLLSMAGSVTSSLLRI